MKVLKFGGACLASPYMLERVVALLKGAGECAVVVSAIAGVTDEIRKLTASSLNEPRIRAAVAALRQRHLEFVECVIKDIELKRQTIKSVETRFTMMERLLYGAAYTEELTKRVEDYLLSFGERFAVHLVAGALNDAGVRARPFEADELGILCDSAYGNGTVNLEESRAAAGPRLHEAARSGTIPVVTGYFGRTKGGHTVTFGRSGSDYSAGVLAYIMGAPRIEIWKEVDGFMSADPRMVPEAFTVDTLSYDEAAELAYFGAQVLHPRIVEPARLGNIEIWIKNLMKPEERGTLVHAAAVKSDPVKSVSYKRGFTVLKVSGSGSGYRPGTMAEITDTVGRAGVNIYSATTSQTCIALLVENRDVERATEALKGILGGVAQGVETVPSTALVCAVGDGLGHSKGVAARVFSAVASAGVNVNMISAGASMSAFHFTVDEADLERCVRAIHAEFFGNGGRTLHNV